MAELHSDDAGGHFGGDNTAQKSAKEWILLAYLV